MSFAEIFFQGKRNYLNRVKLNGLTRFQTGNNFHQSSYGKKRRKIKIFHVISRILVNRVYLKGKINYYIIYITRKYLLNIANTICPNSVVNAVKEL